MTEKFTLKTEYFKFLTSPPQVVAQDIKKDHLRGLIGMQKTIEIHLPHYEIPQLLPHLCIHSENPEFGFKGFLSNLVDFKMMQLHFSFPKYGFLIFYFGSFSTFFSGLLYKMQHIGLLFHFVENVVVYLRNTAIVKH